MSLSTSLIDLFDTIDNSVTSFELQKRVIQSSNIVEMITLDIDLSANGKCKRIKKKYLFEILVCFFFRCT